MVFSPFASRPIFLLATNKVSASFFTVFMLSHKINIISIEFLKECKKNGKIHIGNPTRCNSVHVFVVWPAGRPARPRTQHEYHHDTKVKPEAATAVIELLMMGGKTPETC